MGEPAAGAGAELRARRLDGPEVPGSPPAGVELWAFASPRRVLWGTGAAAVIDVPAPWPEHVGVVATALAAIGGDGMPVALGALPYDRRAPARLTVPEVLHTSTADGERWTTVVRPVGAATTVERPTDGPVADPTEMTVRSVIPPAEWCRAVAAARDRIRDGALTKVVLARELEVVSDVGLDAATLWNRLRQAHPSAYTFAADGFVGASPELLVSRVGSTVRAQPMAGTTARTGHPEVDQRRAGELLGSEKNRAEHQITIDAVHDGLLDWCSYLDAEPSPSVVAAGPVQHLATLVEGRLGSPEPSVLELVAALHPTPAVGGHPTAEALAVQAELEGAARGRYAGPVGWVDRSGNGAFAVGIRAVQLAGTRAGLFAGVGVVADSEPEAELEETRAKAQALLGTIVRL